MRGKVNGRQLQNPNALRRMLTPRIFEGKARVLNVIPGDRRYQIEFDVRGWRYTTDNRHQEEASPLRVGGIPSTHLQRGLFTGARVILAATLRHELDEADKKTNAYTKRVLGGISIYEHIPGSIAYNELENILVKLASNHRMLCIGHVTSRFLEELLPYAEIQDIQRSTAFKYPKKLPRLDCGYRNESRYCSLAMLRYFKDNYNF